MSNFDTLIESLSQQISAPASQKDNVFFYIRLEVRVYN